jgi:hypothetical protein
MPNLLLPFPCYGLASIERIYIQFIKGKTPLSAIIGMFDYSKAPLITFASSNYYGLRLIITIYL